MVLNQLSLCAQKGASKPPFDGFNLADHVGDDPIAVSANRQQLIESLD